jgi:hypothetical protein
MPVSKLDRATDSADDSVHRQTQTALKAIPVSARSKAKVCSRLIAGIAGLNPAEGMDARLLCLLCVVQGAASAAG